MDLYINLEVEVAGTQHKFEDVEIADEPIQDIRFEDEGMYIETPNVSMFFDETNIEQLINFLRSQGRIPSERRS